MAVGVAGVAYAAVAFDDVAAVVAVVDDAVVAPLEELSILVQ